MAALPGRTDRALPSALSQAASHSLRTTMDSRGGRGHGCHSATQCGNADRLPSTGEEMEFSPVIVLQIQKLQLGWAVTWTGALGSSQPATHIGKLRGRHRWSTTASGLVQANAGNCPTLPLLVSASLGLYICSCSSQQREQSRPHCPSSVPHAHSACPHSPMAAVSKPHAPCSGSQDHPCFTGGHHGSERRSQGLPELGIRPRHPKSHPAQL